MRASHWVGFTLVSAARLGHLSAIMDGRDSLSRHD